MTLSGRAGLPNTRGILGLAVLVVLVVWILSSSWYIVAEHEQGVVITFGRVSSYADPGFHLKAPRPIQTVVVLPVKKTLALQFGYREKNGTITEVPEEAMMLTGDENILWADAQVEWRIGDPKKFFYGSQKPETILYNATSASLRSVIGSTELDLAITTGKTDIQNRVMDNLTRLLGYYDIGIHVLAVKLQDVVPPDAVKMSFQAVTDAREMKNTKINEAEKYSNEKVPNARGESNALISNAEATKKERIAHATGDVSQFNALYTEYARNKEVTSKRLVIETLEKVLPGADVYVTDPSDSSTLKYLPLRELKGGSN